VFDRNVEGAIVEANDAFLQMLQFGRQDLVSGRLHWTELTPAESRERDQIALTEAQATGVFSHTRRSSPEMAAACPCGWSALFQSENEALVVLDLSEQKRAEK